MSRAMQELGPGSLALAGRSPLDWCTVEQAGCRGKLLGTVWAGLASRDQTVGTGSPMGLLGGRGRNPQGLKSRTLGMVGWVWGRLDQCRDLERPWPCPGTGWRGTRPCPGWWWGRLGTGGSR